MSKKIFLVFSFLICFFCVFNFVNAESESNFFDVNAYENVYKMSEESDVTLPFVKIFKQTAIFDKALNTSGISIASKTIEMDESISGVQTIISKDTVNIKGKIEYGVIIGTNVVISGNVEKDVLILANSIFITDTANIGGDVIAMAGTIELKGTVSGNFIANCENLTMQGAVKKDFRVNSETINFGEFEVNGKIYIETSSNVNISDRYPDATIKMMLDTTSLEKEVKKADTAYTVRKSIIAVILFALLNLLVIKISPNVFINLANKFKNHSSYSIIMGLVGLITIPLVFVILVILSVLGLFVVTLPALVIYIAILIVIIALAKFITGSVLYEFIKDKLKVNSKLKQFCVMLGIYASLYILCNLPAIGSIAKMATILFSSAFVITGLTRKKVD